MIGRMTDSGQSKRHRYGKGSRTRVSKTGKCNTMVMGPGGYRVSDFFRVGLPLNMVMFCAATFLIPIFWPP